MNGKQLASAQERCQRDRVEPPPFGRLNLWHLGRAYHVARAVHRCPQLDRDDLVDHQPDEQPAESGSAGWA